MIKDYIETARLDHWVKNVTIIPGAVLAWAMVDPRDIKTVLVSIALAFVSALLIGSGNYTINDLLDSSEDKQHPSRWSRPVPSGRVSAPGAYLQWALLTSTGLALAWLENRAFFLTASLFFVMGIIYNVKPFRTKDLVHWDVLTESLNSPIRFLLGWFAAGAVVMPPFSLLMCFWMVAAFFMSVKRLAELRYINDPVIAAAYRKPFAYYDQQRLVSCAVFYAALFGVFAGVFSIIHHWELIIALPLIGWFLAAYMREGFNQDSVIRCPEKMINNRSLMSRLVLTVLVIVACSILHLPWIK